MRITLSLDDDVAVLLERVCRVRGASLNEVASEALRLGLRKMTAPAGRRRNFRTTSVDLGRCLIGNLDDVSEALARAGGDAFRRAE